MLGKFASKKFLSFNFKLTTCRKTFLRRSKFAVQTLHVNKNRTSVKPQKANQTFDLKGRFVSKSQVKGEPRW